MAAALGLTVDYFTKRALARDAFEASLGYLLPDELKDELRWIYGQQLVCVEHDCTIRLEPIPDDGGPRRLRASFETRRTIRNVSNESVEHPTFASVEEWFRGERSEVEPIECEVGGRLLTGDRPAESAPGRALAPSRLDLDRPGVERTLEQRVVLAPGQEAVFRYRGHETHFDSGVLHDSYGAPTLRPRVRVEAPPGIQAGVWFGNRGRAEVTEDGGTYVLPTVLLPFQPVVIRWWPRQSYEEWRAEE